jgi:hypothetical protein
MRSKERTTFFIFDFVLLILCELEDTLKKRVPNMLRAALTMAALGLAGCSDELNSYPFVPGGGYSCTVKISLPKDATVQEWIPLKASRTSGPWIRVRRSDVKDEASAFPKQPPAFEDDVQANLSWFTDPPGAARFDVATLEGVKREPRSREVEFSKPGVYRIWAVTAYPTPATSNVETVTIRLKQ